MRKFGLGLKGVCCFVALVTGFWPSEARAQPVGTSELVGRSVKAINYQHRGGATKIDFRGTQLLSGARGEAKVESKRGYLEIEVEFDGLTPARQFGSEYFTYVLWAITPEGRPENLGEVLLNGRRAKLNVTTQLQTFGLVVTAEPYFSVTYPSDVVVLENAVRPDTRGRIEEIDARYELLRRGQYVSGEKPDELTAKLMVVDPNVPLQLYEARNAVRIARWTGAEKYASESFNKAVDLLLQAEKYQARKRPDAKAASMMARQAVQTAEDARLLTVKRLDEERLAAERKAAAEREETARAKAAAEAKLRSQAEADRQRADQLRSAAEQERLKAEEAAAQANRIRREAEQAAQVASQQRAEAEQAKAAALAEAERIRTEAAAQAEASRVKVEAEGRLRAEAEAARQAAEQEKLKAEEAAAEANRVRQQAEEAKAAALAEADRIGTEAKAKAAQAEAAQATALAELNRLREQTQAELAKLDSARQAALAQKATAESEAERARRLAEEATRLKEKAERDRIELRQKLQEQLSKVLETSNTARGLIVNMSDVLFDTARHTLRPPAREKLARISGILQMQPGLTIEVEGHTDSVGGTAYNQGLSERRADAVRDYLIEQGIQPNTITARGFGELRPKAGNETAAGRQQNRRVELVVSGGSIGSGDDTESR